MPATGLIIAILGRNPVQKGFLSAAKSDSNLATQTFDPSGYVIKLDALLMEGFDKVSTPTKSQVETGATISDHVTPLPDKLNIEAMVSDTPVSFSGIGSFVTGRFSQAAFIALEKLSEDRIPFTFVGGFKVYKNMVMTKFSPVRTFKTGAVLHFTATLEQIRTATSLVIQKVSTVKVNAIIPENKGAQSTTFTSFPVVDAKGDTITAQASAFQGNPAPSPIAQQSGLFDRIVNMLKITPQGLQ